MCLVHISKNNASYLTVYAIILLVDIYFLLFLLYIGLYMLVSWYAYVYMYIQCNCKCAYMSESACGAREEADTTAVVKWFC